jgi:hypothetical protein
MFNFVYPPAPSFLVIRDIFRRTLFRSIPNLCLSFRLRDQVSHSYLTPDIGGPGKSNEINFKLPNVNMDL